MIESLYVCGIALRNVTENDWTWRTHTKKAARSPNSRENCLSVFYIFCACVCGGTNDTLLTQHIGQRDIMRTSRVMWNVDRAAHVFTNETCSYTSNFIQSGMNGTHTHTHSRKKRFRIVFLSTYKHLLFLLSVPSQVRLRLHQLWIESSAVGLLFTLSHTSTWTWHSDGALARIFQPFRWHRCSSRHMQSTRPLLGGMPEKGLISNNATIQW